MSDAIEYPDEARIRVYDVMAQGSSRSGLEASNGRYLDLPVAELARLLGVLGVDGMHAFCLYVQHLEQVPGIDGELTLGVPHFSARWLQAASNEEAERNGSVPLSKNAAARGHQAVERSGLLHALANPSALPGQGARGRTWRAVLNPRLVVIKGGRDDLDGLPRVLRGRPRKDPANPVSRSTRNRTVGAGIPESGKAGTGVDAPPSRWTENRERGLSDLASSLVPAVFREPELADTTSEVTVVSQLLSGDKPGLIQRVLLPALRHDKDSVCRRLRGLFNEEPVGQRSVEVVTLLGLPMERTRRPDLLADLLATTLLGERDVEVDLSRLGVSGAPMLGAVELRERLLVGLLIGLGLRRVGSWGAWLYQATRPDWTPKPGPLLDRFEEIVHDLAVTTGRSSYHEASAAKPLLSAIAGPPSQESVPASDGDRELLSEETIDQHFAAARLRWPMFCRDGTPQADDPVWRSRLVRMYLTAEQRQAELEPETSQQVVNQ